MVQPNGRYAIIHRLEKTVINPVVLWILRSSAHHLLSQWLLIITYEGRQSGREFSTPVLYREDDNKLILLTPKEQTNWWRISEAVTCCRSIYMGKQLQALPK